MEIVGNGLKNTFPIKLVGIELGMLLVYIGIEFFKQSGD